MILSIISDKCPRRHGERGNCSRKVAMCRVIEASNGKEGLEKCEMDGCTIDLVLTDIEMPEMNGAELAERLRARCTDVRILFMSGYTEDKVMREKLIQPGAPFLEKPFTPAVLLEKTRDVLLGTAVA